MIVVGLTGYKGAGKDAVADILVRDYGFTKMAFADPLKRMLRKLNPIVGAHAGGYFCNCENCASQVEMVYLADLYDDYDFTHDEIKKSEYGAEVRRLWERFGTEVIREIDEDFWVKIAHQDLMDEGTPERIVFTDVRFENEAEFIGQLPYVLAEDASVSLWRIARPGVTAGEHPAEQLAGLLGEDVTILNDGSLEDLEHPVSLAMSHVIDGVIPGQMAFDIEGWE